MQKKKKIAEKTPKASTKGGKITLPTTPEEFDKLIASLVEEYSFPDPSHAAAVIAIRISHMPVDQSETTRAYLAGCVIRNLAYMVAQSKSTAMKHKFEIDQLDALLASNPQDQQAIDALEKAVNEGSDYAKTVLAKYLPSLAVVEPTG